MAIGIQICSGTEWRAAKHVMRVPPETVRPFPYGEFFRAAIAASECVFYNSRRTKTRAAGACQYAIDRWDIDSVLVIGTCGGVAEHLSLMDIVLATETIQYDSEDQRPDMGYIVPADPAWLNLELVASPLHAGAIASADRDLTYRDLARLRRLDVFGADWESAAIATVCSLNRVRWAVLRAISDVPLRAGAADAARQIEDYARNTPLIMERLLGLLPTILGKVQQA